MPYSTKPNTTTYDPRKELPLHLDHKPVYALPYEHFDYVEDTDARFISIGLAQYDPDDVSIKVFRHTGEKWTRQSEELPLHRVID
ncbi:MAG: DUF6530 family protein, partial [Proteobacteria bacterium]|nr:DUF6530 family protein [Pseudomonadota bacterium]